MNGKKLLRKFFFHRLQVGGGYETRHARKVTSKFSLFVIRSSLFVVRYSLFVVRCSIFVVLCPDLLLFVG